MDMQLPVPLAARRARDAGIARAHDHAEARRPGWTEQALEFVKQYALAHLVFMGEDVRRYATKRGCLPPPHARAWGAVVTMAARRGLITRAGWGMVSNPLAHCANAAVWVNSDWAEDRPKADIDAAVAAYFEQRVPARRRKPDA